MTTSTAAFGISLSREGSEHRSNAHCAAVADFSQPGILLDDQMLVALKFQNEANE